MKERISRWFNQGLWSVEKVSDAVKKEVITAEEFKEITGLDYEE